MREGGRWSGLERREVGRTGVGREGDGEGWSAEGDGEGWSAEGDGEGWKGGGREVRRAGEEGEGEG